ncbi:MAG: TolC family protein [Planctomycetota bacterium]
MISTIARTHAVGLVTTLTSFGLTACASLDPSDDLGTAGSLFEERTGLPVNWNDPWPQVTGDWRSEDALDPNAVARLALTNHPGIRSAVESVHQARADFVQAHLLPNPVINLVLGFPIDGGPGNPAMGSLLQPLAVLWQRSAEIDEADSRLRAAVFALSDASVTLVADAKRAHAAALFAERDLELETRARELAHESAELVRRQLAVGEASGLQRNRAEMVRVEADLRIAAAEGQFDTARRTLAGLCGLAGTDLFPDLDRTPFEAPESVSELSETDLIELAEAQRLDLAAAREIASGAIDSVRLAELRRFRALSLGVALQRNFQDRNAFGPALGLEIPLFDDGRASVARAESMARAAEAELEAIRQSALVEVRSAWVRYRTGVLRLQSAREELLALATSNLRLAEESLVRGVGDRVAVLDFARREVDAKLRVSQLELAVVESFYELERAAGGRLVVFVEEGEQ